MLGTPAFVVVFFAVPVPPQFCQNAILGPYGTLLGRAVNGAADDASAPSRAMGRVSSGG